MPRDELPLKHPINRSARLVGLVLKDAREAVACHACFIGANDGVQPSPEGRPALAFFGADVFAVARFAALTHLALLLARLFDPGPSDVTIDKTDLASVPILMRLLVDKAVGRHFVAEARGWTPDLDGLEEIHAAGAEETLREAAAIWDAFAASPEGAHAVAALKRFRNRALAHTLDKAFSGAVPTINDLSRLVDCLVAIARPLSLALRGEDWDIAGSSRRKIRHAREFWHRAIEGNRAP